MGLNVVLRYLTSSDFCVAYILWAKNVPESPRNRPDFGNIFYAVFTSVYIYWDDILSHFPDDFWRNLSSNKARTD